MAFLDQVQSSINQAMGSNERNRREITRTLKEDALMDGDESVKAGDWVKIAEVRVGAGQQMEVGQGTPKLHPAEQGRPHFDIQDEDEEEIPGEIRIRHEGPQGEWTPLITQKSADELREPKRSERIVMPKASVKGNEPADEDGYIRIYMKADEDDTITKANTTLRLPVTIRNLRG